MLTDRFSPLAPRYDAVLCDIWGVVHNGVAAYADAVDALARFRAAGGTVILISNAPRPREWVVRSLDRLAVPRESYDGVVTSGDVTRAFLTGHPGETVLLIGPERDHSIFDGLPVAFGALEAADYAVCTGLYDDEKETPDDYRDLLARMHARALFMVCANPDLVVERGERLVYCAGAIADRYASLGGEVMYAGKPHRPIYAEAFAQIAALRGAEVPLARVLAIGDSVRTDLAGATQAGIDCLFVTAGIHAGEVGGRHAPDVDALALMFAEAGVAPAAVMRRLVW
ncbi:MAG TPA: TIGR01459 family HAD-type hydrolase [Xanthobacteraceae bacterium]|nr:TIGR01459 family HAD-type hydrolase [Xanthobacteraceae bacterium]